MTFKRPFCSRKEPWVALTKIARPSSFFVESQSPNVLKRVKAASISDALLLLSCKSSLVEMRPGKRLWLSLAFIVMLVAFVFWQQSTLRLVHLPRSASSRSAPSLATKQDTAREIYNPANAHAAPQMNAGFTFSLSSINNSFRPREAILQVEGEPHNRIPPSTWGVVMIAGGDLALIYEVAVSVEALRKWGGYSGAIHVVKDRPDCFRELERVDDKVFIIPLPLGVGTKKNKVRRFKSVKMTILEIVDSDYVLYIDTDVVVTDSLAPFLNRVEKARDTSKASVFLFEQERQTGYQEEYFHSGVFAVARGRSEGCMAAWRSAFLNKLNKFERDQQALSLIGKWEDDNTYSNCSVYNIDRKMFFAFPTLDLLKKGDAALAKQTFLHFTNTGRLKKTKALREASVAFVRDNLKLGTRQEEGTKFRWLSNKQEC